jgi:hypothetical protein
MTTGTSGLRRGRDGKLYPARPLARQERSAAIDLSYRLVCELGISVRAAQKAMAGEHGLRRSRGAIAADLANFECDLCADRTPGQPDA